ncbi:MAG: GNAT family N-acetyltransferase, partial [Proteobacteria bacterium]|nr:GNAT family N-acetyltransferase [Pseudomonadota bacterium]
MEIRLLEKEDDLEVLPKYIKEWVQHFPENDYIIVFLYLNKQLQCVAPFLLEKKKVFFSFSATFLRFTGFSEFNDFIFLKNDINKDNCYKAIFEYLFLNVSFDLISLGKIRGDSYLFWYLKKSIWGKYLSFSTEVPFNVLCEGMNSNNLKTQKKFMNKFKKNYDYQFHYYSGNKPETLLNEVINIYLKQYDYLSTEKHAKRFNIFSNDNFINFINKIFHDENTIVYFISVDEKIITYDISFLHGRELIRWNSGYDPDFAKSRPLYIQISELFSYLQEKSEVKYFCWGNGG